jgi:hypothetical protein
MVAKILGSKGKRINAFRVYLYLNARSEGCVFLGKEELEQIAADLVLSTRTVKRKLQDLQEWNWLGYDKSRDRYYVRGFRAVAKREGEKSRQGFILDLDEYLADAEKFKAFIAAAWINNLGRYKVYQEYVKHRGGAEEWLKGRSVPKAQPRMLYWWHITATYIAKILDVSVSTAHGYRAAAEKYGFIEVKRHRKEISPGLLATWEASDDKNEVQKASRIRRQNGRLLLDSPLWIRSQVIHYRRLSRIKRKKHQIHSPISLQKSNSPISPLLNRGLGELLALPV